MKSFKLQWRYDVDVRALALGFSTLIVGLIALFFAGQAQRNEVRTGVLKSAIPAQMAAMPKSREKPAAEPIVRGEWPNEKAAAKSDRRDVQTIDLSTKPAGNEADIAILNEKPAAPKVGTGPQIGEPFIMRQEPGAANMKGEIVAVAPQSQIVKDNNKPVDIDMETETVAVIKETVVAVQDSRTAEVPVAAETATVPADAGLDVKSTDVLQEWSAAKLERIRNNRPKQHRLAKNYPEHDIVVCEAGCRRQVEQIVYMAPRPIRNPRRQARMIATAGVSQRFGDAGTNSDNIECLAGCYRTPRVYRPRRQIIGAYNGHGQRRTTRRWR